MYTTMNTMSQALVVEQESLVLDSGVNLSLSLQYDVSPNDARYISKITRREKNLEYAAPELIYEKVKNGCLLVRDAV